MSSHIYIVEYKLPEGDWTPVPKAQCWYKDLEDSYLSNRVFTSRGAAERFSLRVSIEFKSISLDAEVRVSEMPLPTLEGLVCDKHRFKKRYFRLLSAQNASIEKEWIPPVVTQD